MKAKAKPRFQGLGLLALCLVVLAGNGAGGYLYIVAERRSFDAEARNQLTAIADMKVRQLEAWLHERLADAKVFGSNPLSNPFNVTGLVENLDLGPNRADVERWMSLRMELYHYAAMSFWGRDGRRHVWLPSGDSGDNMERGVILQAMRGTEPILVDLHRDVPAGAVHLAVAVPLLSVSSPEPLGALLLEIDPGQFLDPLIQSWPVHSRSAETLLVRREGNEVVFLNEGRHRKDTALKLHFPVTRTELPAARGVLGYEGAMEGIDDRGIPVLAVTRAVPGTSWVMVAEVDTEEILAPQRERTRLLALMFSVLAGATLIGSLLFLSSRQAEAVVRATEVRYQRLFESAKDGILILDAETGIVLDANPYMTEMLGFPHEAFLGKRLWEVGFLKDVVANQANILGLQQKGYVRYEDLPLETAEGQRKDVEFVSNVYLVGNQKVIQCNIRDITERKRAEEERQSLQLQLAQAQKMETVGRLAGGVAHDFNNLLTVINGYSELALSRTPPEDPRFQGLSEVLRAGERAASLVRQLLAFSRKQVLQPEVLDLNVTVGAMESMLRRLVGDDVEVVVRLEPGVPPVLADRHQLEQVIMNLAVNSRDAMPGGGTLTLETGQRHLLDVCGWCQEQIRPGTYVELIVRDTGTGMDQETLKHLFEPFFTTKGVGKGTGLGLSTVQGIVVQSGGHVGAQSSVGKGSAIHVCLPVANLPTAERRAVAVAGTVGGKETILLVEDQKEVREFIATLLGKYGYKVVPARDAEDALRVCAAQAVDLLVTDVVMPKMSGVELAQRLRLTLPELRTVFISGYSKDMHEREWGSVEGADFLQKPFASEALAAKVREVLNGR